MNTAGELVRFLTLYGRPPAFTCVAVEFQWEPKPRGAGGWFVMRTWDHPEHVDAVPRDAANDPVALWGLEP